MYKKITILALSCLMFAGCFGFSRAQIEEEKMYNNLRNEAKVLSADIVRVRDAQLTEDSVKAWVEFENSFTTSEAQLRQAGAYSSRESAKLRHRYLEASKELEAKLASKRAMYDALIAKSQNQEKGWVQTAQLQQLKIDLDKELNDFTKTAFVNTVTDILKQVQESRLNKDESNPEILPEEIEVPNTESEI